ncbi:MAG: hypothetical protein JO122_01710, partial [Acetobacteraceae bacterium]|nr:hypothetical protein [Acetobacteraceae bacterium]
MGTTLDLGTVEEREIYAALDWLGRQQERIERGWQSGTSATARWFCTTLPRRIWKAGSANSPASVTAATIARIGRRSFMACLKQRFGLRRIVLVGDRGMITAARIRDDLKPAGLDWITTLRAPQITQLVETGPLQLSLFDERDRVQIPRTGGTGVPCAQVDRPADPSSAPLDRTWVRAHVFLWMLAYYIEWHLRQAWSLILFDGTTTLVPKHSACFA